MIPIWAYNSHPISSLVALIACVCFGLLLCPAYVGGQWGQRRPCASGPETPEPLQVALRKLMLGCVLLLFRCLSAALEPIAVGDHGASRATPIFDQ